MKFEIIDVIQQADIIILFNGKSYQNTRDGFMKCVDEPQRLMSVKRLYTNIRHVQNDKRCLIAKRCKLGQPLEDVKHYYYKHRKSLTR